MNKPQERQTLIALLPKRFQFHSNDPILRKHPHLSGSNDRNEQKDSLTQQIKKNQELKIKHLIITKKRNKSKQNMEKYLEDGQNQLQIKNGANNNQNDGFRMINLNMIDKKYRIIGGGGGELRDQIGKQSFNLQQVQYETLGEEEDEIDQKLITQVNMVQKVGFNQMSLNSQQNNQAKNNRDSGENSILQQSQENKNQQSKLNDLRKRRKLINLELSNKQMFDHQYLVQNGSTSKSSSYQNEFQFNTTSLNSSPKNNQKMYASVNEKQGDAIQQISSTRYNQSHIKNQNQPIELKIDSETKNSNKIYGDSTITAQFIKSQKGKRTQQSSLSSSNQNSTQCSKDMINDILNISSYNQSQDNKLISQYTPKQFYGNPVNFIPIGQLSTTQNTFKDLEQSKQFKKERNNSPNNPATLYQDVGSPQIIFRKKKETMNKILGLLSKEKQPNIYQQIINRNKQIHLTGHHIQSFSNAYKSHLGNDISQLTQQNILEIQQQQQAISNLSSRIPTQLTERVETEKEIVEARTFQNITIRKWINESENTKDSTILGKSEDMLNYCIKLGLNGSSSPSNTFYPYNLQNFEKSNKPDLISIHKIPIQPRINFKNYIIQRPLSTQNTPQGYHQSSLFNSSNPTSPSRFSTPKDFQRKNIQTPTSQIGQYDEQRSKSSIYQPSRKCSINKNNNIISGNKSNQKQNESIKKEVKHVLDQIVDCDKIESWDVNENYESMSPLIEQSEIFFN